MADVNNDFMFEFLKKMQERFDRIDLTLGELKSELNSMRGTMVAMQGDLHNIYGILGRHDERLDRIERRLELHELAEPSQQPYEPK